MIVKIWHGNFVFCLDFVILDDCSWNIILHFFYSIHGFAHHPKHNITPGKQNLAVLTLLWWIHQGRIRIVPKSADINFLLWFGLILFLAFLWCFCRKNELLIHVILDLLFGQWNLQACLTLCSGILVFVFTSLVLLVILGILINTHQIKLFALLVVLEFRCHLDGLASVPLWI